MNYTNYVKIDTKLLKQNIEILKQQHNYQYYILDVSNNAFGHGMYSILSLMNDIDYCYVNSFQDVLLLRKYNQNIPIIYDGEISENNVYDLILHNVIFVIKSKEILENLLNWKIKDKFDIIFSIDLENLTGIYSKHILIDILELLKEQAQIHILGIKASITEKKYDDFRYVISPLKNLDLVLLNNETDKKKIKLSNAILLDASIYGLTIHKKKNNYKQAYHLYSKIDRVIIQRKKHKDIDLGIIPYGYKNGMLKDIKKVWIQNQLYNILDVKEDATIIKIDSSIKKNDLVEITGEHNPINIWLKENSLYYFEILGFNLPLVYEDYIIEKTFIY